jgi:hypothetical protein
MRQSDDTLNWRQVIHSAGLVRALSNLAGHFSKQRSVSRMGSTAYRRETGESGWPGRLSVHPGRSAFPVILRPEPQRFTRAEESDVVQWPQTSVLPCANAW